MHPSLFGLTAYAQFIVHRSKMPCDYRTGLLCNAHDPQYWTDAETAMRVAQEWGAGCGVGFVFTASDPFFFCDIDNCLTPQGWSPLAQQICAALPGCAVEISQSGRGLHIFGTGVMPDHGCRNQSLGLELYHAGRYAALTGNGAVGDCMTDAAAALPALIAQYFPPDAPVVATAGDGPDPEWCGPESDEELLRRAMQSRSSAAAFSGRASFADLWLANEQALAVSYPDANGRPYDASAADAALAQHLAFWTGRDTERIQRLMGQSALVRDKWNREDYLPRTIAAAVGRQVDVLQDARPVAAAEGVVSGPGPQPLTDSGHVDQQAHFAGCVYVRSQGRVLTPDGCLLKPDAFRVRYGGFIFKMDLRNDRVSRDAYEAWTQSQIVRPVEVEGLCFRPELAPREIVSIDGLRYINSYMPVDIPRKVGDATPFLEHLTKVLPDERDRSILMSYMAACVQHQGVKFQWAPLLQGVEGNGKTLFARCVEQAVGTRYTHWPKASKIGKDFNAWMVGKVFYAVEDIYVPDSKREILEDLKPMITGDSIEIEAKGVDQVAMNICGNFMFNSNHKDAIRKTDNDRRFCVLFSAQQRAEDLARDGMGGEYFPELYKWLRADGYAIVSELLHTWPIPDALNPAKDCQRAPMTTSTQAAVTASLGAIEQEILEAIDQGQPGFCGGFISSHFVALLIERIGRHVPQNKRRDIMENLGYIPHPALTGGRVNSVVTPDGSRPRLYVVPGSLQSQIPSASEAARAYENANRPVFGGALRAG